MKKWNKHLVNIQLHQTCKKAGWKTGEQKKIACWIDETVTVKARKE
ncbi:MAG: hypothetical protein QM734_02435 [Cyclobacteriaceae bacterium]